VLDAKNLQPPISGPLPPGWGQKRVIVRPHSRTTPKPSTSRDKPFDVQLANTGVPALNWRNIRAGTS